MFGSAAPGSCRRAESLLASSRRPCTATSSGKCTLRGSESPSLRLTVAPFESRISFTVGHAGTSNSKVTTVALRSDWQASPGTPPRQIQWPMQALRNQLQAAKFAVPGTRDRRY
eukprot:762679-Hanusia_phi.AAC.2